MKIIGHLGFRKGSKGVKSKNTRMLLGKPLFVWSLEQLLELDFLDGICISTDDKDALDIVSKYNLIDIGVRSADLANDSAAKFNVWQDSARKLDDRNYKFDALLDLDCTAPLRNIADIKNAVKVFKLSDADIVLSVTDARKNPYFNLLEEQSDGTLKISKGDGKIFSRQSAPKVYEHVSSTYLISSKYLNNGKYFNDAILKGFYMPPERSIDIDSELDWDIVKYLFEKKFNHE